MQQRASLKTALLEAKLSNLQGKDLAPKELQVNLYVTRICKQTEDQHHIPTGLAVEYNIILTLQRKMSSNKQC